MVPNRQDLRTKLALLGGVDEAGFTAWVGSFAQLNGPRATVNLRLIDEQLGDRELLLDILEQLFAVADPDSALNVLERLFDIVGLETLLPLLRDPQRRSQLLILLGGSPFLPVSCAVNRSILPN